MRCRYCGEEFMEGDVFCGNCGRRLDEFSENTAKPRGPDKTKTKALQVFLTVSLLALTSTLAVMLCVVVPGIRKEEKSQQESETVSAKTSLQEGKTVSEEAGMSETAAVTEKNAQEETEAVTAREETTQGETDAVTEVSTTKETETITEETVREETEAAVETTVPAQTNSNMVTLDGSFFADGQQRESESGYILPESESVYLTEADVSYLSLKGLCYAKNEIFARHHRKFSSSELSTWFTAMPWYSGEIEPADFTDSVVDSTFNEYEKKNMYLLSSMETSRGLYQLDQ